MKLSKRLYLWVASDAGPAWSITYAMLCIWGFISLFSAGIRAGQTGKVNIKRHLMPKGALGKKKKKKLYLGFLRVSKELLFLLLSLAILFQHQ